MVTFKTYLGILSSANERFVQHPVVVTLFHGDT